LKYVLAILNSSLSLFILSASGKTKGAVHEFRTDTLSQFPIRRIKFHPDGSQRLQEAGANIRNVDDIIGERSWPTATNLIFRLFQDTNGQFEAAHDLLDYLADQMMSSNGLRQAEVTRFTKWLGTTLRPIEERGGVGALIGASTLRSYAGDYQKNEGTLPFDELMDILHRNRTRLGVSLNDARFVARLKSEYEKSLAVLLPIKERLAFTDQLIDQIVYRLYGLTEEEIQFIEGNLK
jgi:hypothetical protein